MPEGMFTLSQGERELHETISSREREKTDQEEPGE